MATINLKLKPWETPNFAVVEEGPRPKQEGFRVAPTIPVSDLSEETLRELAQEWVSNLYQKAGKPLDQYFVTSSGAPSP